MNDKVSFFHTEKFDPSISQDISNAIDLLDAELELTVIERPAPDGMMMNSFMTLMAGTAVIAGGTLLLSSMLKKLGEASGEQLALYLKTAFRKSIDATPIFVTQHQIEEMLKLPSPTEREALRLKLGSKPPVIEIRIFVADPEKTGEIQFSFKFPSEISEDEFIDAIKALGPDYPTTLRALFEGDTMGRFSLFQPKIEAHYNPGTCTWISRTEFVNLLKNNGKGEANVAIDDIIERKSTQEK